MTDLQNDMILSDIEKSYNRKQVLRNCSLRFPKNTTTVMMGPSGSGKTTILRILAGLEKPDRGSVVGVQRDDLAMVFQEARLFGEATALENVRAVLHGNRRETKSQALAWLARAGLADAAETKARALSGGMAHRVAIVRALASGCKTIFMDEPFAGLDAENEKRMIELVRGCCIGKTLVLVTHRESVAAAFGGKVYHISSVETSL